MSKGTQFGLKLTAYKDGNPIHSFTLNKRKSLIGQFAHADITINDPHLSHYHALLSLTDDQTAVSILDLESSNGSYLNGVKIKSATASVGDVIRLGLLDFYVEEDVVLKVSDHDHEIGVVQKSIECEEKPTELKGKEGLVVIDGEYCDIVFDEKPFVPQGKVDLHVELHDVDTTDLKDTNIIREVHDFAVEVSLLAHGTILSIDHFDLFDRTIKLSNHKTKDDLLLDCFRPENPFKFITIKDEKVVVRVPDEFKLLFTPDAPKEIELTKESLIALQYNNFEILVRLTKAPPKVVSSPFFTKDRYFTQLLLKSTGAVLVTLLLLFLVKIPIETPPVKEIAIIYKEPTRKSAPAEAASSSAQMASASNNQVQVAQANKEVGTIKAYEFKMDSNLKGLFAKSNVVAAGPSNANNPSSTSVLSGSSSGIKGGGSSGSVGGGIGTIGEGLSGTGTFGKGVSGVARGKGIENLYVDPRTVVLGSIDPELLRRILEQYLPQFRHCYQMELQKKNDDLKGVIDLNFRIGSDGRVIQMDIKSQGSFSQEATNCMGTVLKVIEFPKPKGGGVVDVKQPLNFEASNQRI